MINRDRQTALVLSAVIFLVLILAGFWMKTYAREADFGQYRLAQNLRAGHGLVMNAGEHDVLVIHVLPVLPLVLAPQDAPQIAVVVMAIAYALSGMLVFWVVRRAGMNSLEGIFIVLLWLIAWPVWAGYRSPSALMILATLSGLELAERGHWRWAGWAAGLAVLIEPEGVLACVLLGIYLISLARAWSYWQTVWIPGVFWIVLNVLFLTDGDINELEVLGAIRETYHWQGIIWLGLLIPSAGLLSYCRADHRLWFFMLWAVAEVMTLSSQDGVLPLAVSAALITGIRLIRPRMRSVAVMTGSVGMLALLLLAPPRTDPHLAEDIELGTHLNLPSDATIAHDRSDAFTYYALNAEGKAYCLDGEYSPLVNRLLEQHDPQSVIVALAPDYLYFNTRKEPFSRVDLSGYELSTLAYTQQPSVLQIPGVRHGDVYLVRQMEVGTFGEVQSIGLEFGEDVRLTGYAVDRVRLLPDHVLRVRLDWELDRPPEKDVDVYLNLLDGSPISSTYSRFPARLWKSLSPSTYQVLVIPGDVQPGVFSLYVTLGYDAGTLGQNRLGEFIVPPGPPPADIPLAEDGELGILGTVVLHGARVTPQPGQLLVELTWSTRRSLPDDYHIFVHLTPLGDVMPVSQRDSEPANGRYPTRFWLPGELVFDQHYVPLQGVPAGRYLVRTGLYLPEGERLRGEQGDHLVLAQVQIQSDGTVTVEPPD